MDGKDSSGQFLQFEADREEKLVKEAEERIPAVSSKTISQETKGRREQAKTRWAELEAEEESWGVSYPMPVQ
jgi:hypothetical protein